MKLLGVWKRRRASRAEALQIRQALFLPGTALAFAPAEESEDMDDPTESFNGWGRMRIPHEFRAYDKRWKVRWWQDRDCGFPGFNPRLHHSHVDERTRIITMHPDLKGRPRQAFEALVHEVMHIINFEERKRIGRSRYRLRHDVIYHLDEPLAFALMGMGVSFRCVCSGCGPRVGADARARNLSRRTESAGREAAQRDWGIGETEKREKMPRRRARGGTSLPMPSRLPSDRAIAYDEPART